VSTASTASLPSWNAYLRACAADSFDPIPITLPKVLAFWSFRVLGSHLKSSGLESVTSRLLTHATLNNHTVSPDVIATIWAELPRFCSTFPCEVAAAAPPLSITTGLQTAISFTEACSANNSFFLCMHTLLLVSQALYCRPSSLLAGRLRRSHLSSMPASSSSQGGLVLNLMLPKKRKTKADRRLDAHPIPNGPAVRSLLSLLDALGILAEGSTPDAIVFPDIDPFTGAIIKPALTVRRSTTVLRRYVFVPAGIPNGNRLTLRSIRSGSSSDAAIAGVAPQDRLDQGGWKTAAGAATYLDRAFVILSSPAASGIQASPATCTASGDGSCQATSSGSSSAT
jgi:hypothetical protein